MKKTLLFILATLALGSVAMADGSTTPDIQCGNCADGVQACSLVVEGVVVQVYYTTCIEIY